MLLCTDVGSNGDLAGSLRGAGSCGDTLWERRVFRRLAQQSLPLRLRSTAGPRCPSLRGAGDARCKSGSCRGTFSCSLCCCGRRCRHGGHSCWRRSRWPTCMGSLTVAVCATCCIRSCHLGRCCCNHAANFNGRKAARVLRNPAGGRRRPLQLLHSHSAVQTANRLRFSRRQWHRRFGPSSGRHRTGNSLPAVCAACRPALAFLQRASLVHCGVGPSLGAAPCLLSV